MQTSHSIHYFMFVGSYNSEFNVIGTSLVRKGIIHSCNKPKDTYLSVYFII